MTQNSTPKPVQKSSQPSPANQASTPTPVSIPALTPAPTRQTTDNPSPDPEITKTNACVAQSPFDESVRFAIKAANLVQKAESKSDWDEVSRHWVQAVAWMQAVPPDSPKRAYAEKKVAEYMRNLAYAQQQATKASTKSAFPSFNSKILDQQLRLYLSYISTIGKPDVLIVGSSRALQGIDPSQMRQSLAAEGYKELEVFNFGVNGATAQVVDYILRQLLTPDQLPQVVVWADGVRAFNSGRIDRTYDAIMESMGNQKIAAGIRPQVPSMPPDRSVCHEFPQPCKVKQSKWQAANNLNSRVPAIKPLGTQIAPARLRFLANPALVQETLTILGATSPIDANGFLSLSTRYDPETYYQARPYVSGTYDGDYRAFNLGGPQLGALSSVTAFLKSQNIPLILVSLPVTDDYLDAIRGNAEAEFNATMGQLSAEYGFIFINFSEQSLTRYEYFVDPSHLNTDGARAVAQKLAAEPTIPWPKSQLQSQSKPQLQPQ
ncbi:MAG: hypothetical protein HC825_07935 [Oscillatoriales cyanobacterium RM1_1_9]|nr:hypothetical protein [Oscillatoriales cyanobacterium SM2_3_0]NJO44998.1 hypothetical protein [Oscillatoriales cyanobacterium RM2_1_1]NJO71628.1 hypothetical protein [Oscillatoriales cyanobacterium RM1_1_9]